MSNRSVSDDKPGDSLFVVTNAATFSPAARAAARSHAASKSRRKGTRRSPAPASCQLHGVLLADNKIKRTKQHNAAQPGSSQSQGGTPTSDRSIQLDSVQMSSQSTPAELAITQPQSSHDDVRTESVSPRSLLDTEVTDPFSTTAMPISKEMDRMLRSCRVFRAANRAVSPLVQQFKDWSLPCAMQEPLLFCAAMYLACSEAAQRPHSFANAPSYHTGPVDVRNDAEISASHFRLQAIKHMNAQLRSSQIVTAIQVCAVLWLLDRETYEGNDHEAFVHRSGLEHMFKSAHRDTLPLHLVLNVTATLYRHAAIRRMKPPFPPPMLDQSGVPIFIWQSVLGSDGIALDATAPGYYSSDIEDLLGHHLMEPIRRTRLYFRYWCLIYDGVMSQELEDSQYFFALQQAIDFEILSIPFEDSDNKATPTQEAVCLSLFLSPPSPVPICKARDAIVSHLRNALSKTDLSGSWSPCTELLVWVLFAGVQVSDSSNDDRIWFMQHLARCVLQLGLETAEELGQVLEGFFYLNSFSNEILLEVWDHVAPVRRSAVGP